MAVEPGVIAEAKSLRRRDLSSHSRPRVSRDFEEPLAHMVAGREKQQLFSPAIVLHLV